MPGLALHYIMGQQVCQVRHIIQRATDCGVHLQLGKGLCVRLHLAHGVAQ